jgi:hypothetical protein
MAEEVRGIKKFIKILSLFLTFSLLVCMGIVVSAKTMPYFTYSLDKAEADCGDFVKLQINANRVSDPAAGFKITVGYDSSVLSFICTETSSKIKSGTLVTNCDNNPIYSVYVCNTDKNEAPELSGNIISFVFKVNDDASLGKTYINAHLNDVCNYQAKDLNLNIAEELSLNVINSDKNTSAESKALLSALHPLQGVLVPSFSPNVYKYSMEVDSDVTSVEFAASAYDGGAVKINRKSLQKPGTVTPILVTVTSEDKKGKAYYAVNVKRLSASEKGSSETNKGSNISKKKSSKSPTGTKKVNGNNKSDKVSNNKTNTKDDSYIPASDSLSKNGQSTQPPGDVQAGSRNIYVIGNQTPVYIIGMLTAVLCIMVGIILCFYLKIKKQ